jgi:hypothetical protein
VFVENKRDEGVVFVVSLRDLIQKVVLSSSDNVSPFIYVMLSRISAQNVPSISLLGIS